MILLRMAAYVAGLYLLIRFKKKLTWWIMAGMVLGIETGISFPDFAVHCKILSTIFLRLIKCIVAPLLLGTLVGGIAGHSDLRQLGRLGWKSLLYFEGVTTLALFIGLAAINLSGAGYGLSLSASSESLSGLEIKQPGGQDIIIHAFPENIAKSIAEGQVLQVVVFSILFAIGLVMVKAEKRRPMLTWLESLSETMFKFTHVVMYLAPLAVFGAIAATIAGMGPGVLVNLFKLLLTLYAALLFFVLAVLFPIALVCRIPIKKFIRAVSEPVSLAFATASSEAALPDAMEKMEAFGVPGKIVSFVMPTGYSFNLDGTTLYLSLASVFVAQAAGIELSFGTQLAMVFTLMLTSKGVAGVPRASLVILLGTLSTFNLPPEPVFAILGIDALMDMVRTGVNVLGNCLASAVIARWEGELETKEA
jgi:proton glutamate symport protein